MKRLATVLLLLLAACGGATRAVKKIAVEAERPSPALQRCYEVTALPRLAQEWGDTNATIAAFLSFEEEEPGCEPLLVPADKPAAEATVLRAGLALQRLQMHRLAAQAYFSEQSMPETCSTLQRGLRESDAARPLFDDSRKLDDAVLPETMRGLGPKVADEANRLTSFFVFAREMHCAAGGSGE